VYCVILFSHLFHFVVFVGKSGVGLRLMSTDMLRRRTNCRITIIIISIIIINRPA